MFVFSVVIQYIATTSISKPAVTKQFSVHIFCEELHIMAQCVRSLKKVVSELE